MNDVLTRLDKLEKENRRLKRGGIAAFILIAAFAVMGQAQSSRVVEAEKIVLRTGSKTFAELGIDVSGTPALSFFDESGKRVAEYRTGDVAIFGKNGWSRMSDQNLVLDGSEGHIDLTPTDLSIRDNIHGLGFISIGMKKSLTREDEIEPEMHFNGNNGKGFVLLSAIEGLHLEPGTYQGKPLPGGIVNVSAVGPFVQVAGVNGKVIWSAP